VIRTEKELERRNRILVARAAYAYEILDSPVLTDSQFDDLAKSIRPEMSTIEDYHSPEQISRYTELDRFFKEQFSAYTGSWIRKHPEYSKLEVMAHSYQYDPELS